MKILHLLYDHIHNPWIGGGAAVRAYEIYKQLAQKGHQITIISGKYPDCKDIEEKNLQFKFVGTGKNYILSTFSYAYFANQFLKNNFHKFDVIIEDFAPWNPVFSYKIARQKPIILQIHHREEYNILKKYFILGIPFFIIEKFYPKKFINISSVSQQTSYKYSLKNYKIIPNGIDENLLKINTNNTNNYILYVGRIDLYNKGIDLLIQATHTFPLAIAGKGKDEKKLKTKIKSKKNIKFYGFVDNKEKIDLISNAKFLVMPSRFEGQGIVALEAAALGKPLIVSDIPELYYVVENGFGICFKKDDPEDLAKKIKFLWDNPKLTAAMGKKGRQFAQNFTWEQIAKTYEEYLLQTYREFHSC